MTSEDGSQMQRAASASMTPQVRLSIPNLEECLVERISWARKDTLPKGAAEVKVTTVSGLGFIVSPIECESGEGYEYSGFRATIGVCDGSRPQIRKSAPQVPNGYGQDSW